MGQNLPMCTLSDKSSSYFDMGKAGYYLFNINIINMVWEFCFDMLYILHADLRYRKGSLLFT